MKFQRKMNQLKGVVFSTFVAVSALPGAGIANPLWSEIENATYRVPVSNEDNSEFATFALEGLRVGARGNAVRIKYKLPFLLTGADQSLSFRGTMPSALNPSGENPVVLNLTSVKGKMQCELLDLDFGNCRVKYDLSQIRLDEVALRTHLENSGVAATEIEARMQIFADFSNDGAGSIRFSR